MPHKQETSEPVSVLKKPTAEQNGALAPRDHPHHQAMPKFSETGGMSPEWQKALSQMSPLQQHCAYFLSRPDAQVIYPWDTWVACRAWGWNMALVALTVFIIHGGLGYFTQPPGHILPEPRFPVYISHVHRAKHGSDSQTYSNTGKFRQQVFDGFFEEYDKGQKGGLTFGDLVTAWSGQRNVLDFFGTFAFAFEWLATYLLVWPHDGILRKDEIEGLYDGSMFWRVKEREDRKRKQEMLKQ